MKYDIIKNELDLVLIPKSKITNIDSIIHDEMEDLAIVYCFIEEKGLRPVIKMLQKDVLDVLCVSEDQLKKDAVRNSVGKHKMQICSIGFAVAATNLDDIPMYVALTSDGKFGAKVMAYPGFFEYAAATVGCSYYILPSSIHELILLKDNTILSLEEIKDIVIEVNSTEVSDRDFLSDEVYHYDVNTKKFENASAYYNRVNRLS